MGDGDPPCDLVQHRRPFCSVVQYSQLRGLFSGHHPGKISGPMLRSLYSPCVFNFAPNLHARQTLTQRALTQPLPRLRLVTRCLMVSASLLACMSVLDSTQLAASALLGVSEHGVCEK